MATEQKRILVRRGNKADLVVTDLQPGELVLALDTNEIGVKTSGGTVLWFATLNADGLVAQGLAPVDHTTIALPGKSYTYNLHLYKFGHLILAYCDSSWVNFGSFTAATDIATIPLEWSPPIGVALPVLNQNSIPNTTGGRIVLRNGKVTLSPSDWSKSFEGSVVPVVFFK